MALRPAQWFEKFDPITRRCTRVRLLGDRKGIEEQTKILTKVIVDRTRELSEWAETLRKLKIQVYTYVNNHFAGYAPGTVETFQEFWRRLVATETGKRNRAVEQGRLFK